MDLICDYNIINKSDVVALTVGTYTLLKKKGALPGS